MRIVETDTMDARGSDRLSADEFLEWMAGPSAPEGRWELVAGVPVRMMVNVRRAHSTAVANMMRHLGNRLDGSSCRPHAEGFGIQTGNDQVRYPDVMVDCGAGNDEDMRAREPRVVVEVLSNGTRTFDQTSKLVEYQGVPTIYHVLFVETGVVEVTHFTREAGRWEREDHFRLDSSIRLSALGVELTVGEIYDGIDASPMPRFRVVRDE